MTVITKCLNQLVLNIYSTIISWNMYYIKYVKIIYLIFWFSYYSAGIRVKFLLVYSLSCPWYTHFGQINVNCLRNTTAIEATLCQRWQTANKHMNTQCSWMCNFWLLVFCQKGLEILPCSIYNICTHSFLFKSFIFICTTDIKNELSVL
jgi:hypothetical protein